mmetsp:Transcript_132573/g.412191  ORF Transcript_132573/g.412191 Transcript_132573/m.412191 type:complete len:349 (+) Transcript_132573:57-1103(+)
MFALRLLAALWVADALHLGGPKLLPIDGTWMPLSQLFLAGPENCEAKVSTALHHLESTLSYEHRFRVQEAFEDANATTMLIVGTRHTTCMTDNFLVHADSLTTPSPIVHVALDSLAHRSCTEHFQPRSRSLACVDLSSWLPIDVSSYGPTTSLSDNVGFGTCAYRLIAWTKPLLLKVALSATPQRIFLIDTDVILYADLAGWIERNAREDSLLVAGDEYMRRLPNTGTLVTDAASRPLLDLWLARAGDPDDHMPATGARFADQGGLVRLLRTRQDFNHTVQLVPRAVLGLCGGKGRYASHYTCVDKIAAMQARGEWTPWLDRCRDGFVADTQLYTSIDFVVQSLLLST